MDRVKAELFAQGGQKCKAAYVYAIIALIVAVVGLILGFVAGAPAAAFAGFIINLVWIVIAFIILWILAEYVPGGWGCLISWIIVVLSILVNIAAIIGVITVPIFVMKV